MTQTLDRPTIIPLDQQPDVNDGREPVNQEVKCAYGLAACAGDCEPCEVIDKSINARLDRLETADMNGTLDCSDQQFDSQWHFNYEDRCIYTTEGEFVIQAKVGGPAWWERLLGEHNALVLARR